MVEFEVKETHKGSVDGHSYAPNYFKMELGVDKKFFLCMNLKWILNGISFWLSFRLSFWLSFWLSFGFKTDFKFQHKWQKYFSLGISEEKNLKFKNPIEERILFFLLFLWLWLGRNSSLRGNFATLKCLKRPARGLYLFVVRRGPYPIVALVRVLGCVPCLRASLNLKKKEWLYVEFDMEETRWVCGWA